MYGSRHACIVWRYTTGLVQQGLAAMLVSPYLAFGILMRAVTVASVQCIGLLCPRLAANRVWHVSNSAPESADLMASRHLSAAITMPFAG